MYAVKLSTDLSVSIIEKKREQSFLDFCYRSIGCRYAEHVNARGLMEPYVLMIDEEGRLGDKPVINFIASYLYGAHDHHEPIVGNAIVVKLGMTFEGMDILPLDEAEAQQVKQSMISIAPIAYRKVLAAFRDTAMRNQLYNALKHFFRCKLQKTRTALNLSREGMAHILTMRTRAYTDLESGKTCCRLITFLLFLRHCYPDRHTFLNDLFAILDSLESDAA